MKVVFNTFTMTVLSIGVNPAMNSCQPKIACVLYVDSPIYVEIVILLEENQKRRAFGEGFEIIKCETPSEISDIILSIGTEYRIRDDIGLTDLMYLDENWKFNRLNSENENERNENMTNWVSDHLDKFINDMNNSAPNPESQWDIADNREENARIFREEVQRANFNRDLPVWFITSTRR